MSFPFSAIPGLRATEVEGGEARPLHSPGKTCSGLSPLGSRGLFAGKEGWDISPDWNAAVLPEAMRGLVVQAGSAALTAPSYGSGKSQ